MTLIDLTTTSSNWKNSKYNFSISGKYSILVDKGNYFLECWGSKGSDSAKYDSYIAKGGKGGYSSGVYSVPKQMNLFVYVGGIGSSSTTGPSNGGFNGGGDCGQYAAGGGGATDFRLNESASSRIIIAGGGGGANGGSFHVNGGSGGGSNGFSGQQGSGYGITCFGSQTGCSGGTENPRYPNVNGSFGEGAGTSLYHYSGGGGGYYGGGSTHVSGGGGGSGFIGFVHSYLNYLSITHSGEDPIVSPSGTSTTGNDGSGYARITFIDSKTNNRKLNQSCHQIKTPLFSISIIFFFHYIVVS